MVKRKDSKGRILQKNEYQAKDGRYFLIYENNNGKKCRVYSWALNPTDIKEVIKQGKKCEYSIRELKKQILDDSSIISFNFSIFILFPLCRKSYILAVRRHYYIAVRVGVV